PLIALCDVDGRRNVSDTAGGGQRTRDRAVSRDACGTRPLGWRHAASGIEQGGRGVRHPKKILVVAGVIAGSAAAGVAGWAYFDATGSGPGAGAVGGMAPPTGLTATVPDSKVRTVHLAWTAPSSPDGSGLSGYTVTRW